MFISQYRRILKTDCGSRKYPYPKEGIFALDPPSPPGISIPGRAWNTPHTPGISVIFHLDWVPGTALTWTLLLPVWKVFTSTRNQMYALDTSRNPLQSCLVFHSILDLLQKTSFWANFYLSYAGDWLLSYDIILLSPQGFRPEGEIQRRHSSNSCVY